MYQSIVVTVLLFGYVYSIDVNCNFTITVTPGVTYDIRSPNYSNSYNPGSECRWIATCPTGYNCRLDCYDINMPQSSTCSVDRLLISKTGDPFLTGADYYCGQGSVSAVSTGTRIAMGNTDPAQVDRLPLRFAEMWITNVRTSRLDANAHGLPNAYTTVFAYTCSVVSRYTTGGRFRCNLYAQTATATTPDCVCGVRRTNRIVGGVQTDPYEYPMMAGVRYAAQDSIRCGGVIIANNYVLTAAHCVVGMRPADITVEVGVYNQANSPLRQSLRVLSIRTHPNFVQSNYDYDIAVLGVSAMTFNEYVSPVCLPVKYANVDFTGTRLTYLGWGTTFFGGPTSSVLRKVDLDVISQATCRNTVPALTPRQFCTFNRGKDACQDDSGGPGLFSEPQTGLIYIFGLISYGQGCASETPGVSTRVNALLTWITDNAPANYCIK